MPPVNSNMLELGTPAPDFTLPDYGVDGENGARRVSFSDVATDKATLVMFICNHCPFVIHVQDELARLAKDYMPRGVGIVAVNSNNVETHPDDAPAKMTEKAREVGYPFPYLFDETQEVAGAYRAACTPDFYLFDGDRRLVYRGQLDDSRPNSGDPVTGADLRSALDAVLEGREPPAAQKPSMGCGIKWKPGNEPG
jgi:thiol-disulfide isomerase/thioredoxin